MKDYKFINELLKKKELLQETTNKFRTPMYVIITENLDNKIKKIKTSFISRYKNTKIYYSYKTNDVPYICKRIHSHGIGAEVSSLLELMLAKKLGVKNIIFNSPGKTYEEIIFAIKNKAIIICDCEEEIKLINDICKELKKHIAIGIRINPHVLQNSSWTKFGVNIRILPSILRKEFSNLNIEGIHFHIGTQIKNPKVFCKAIKILEKEIKRTPKKILEKIKYLDIGGGFSSENFSFTGKKEFIIKYLSTKNKYFIKYFKRDFLFNNPPTIDLFADRIIKELKRRIISRFPQKIELKLEPGRYIINSSIYLILKVLFKKDGCVILNGGINLCPNIIYSYHPIINLSKPSKEIKKTTLYGPLCLSNDLFGNAYFGETLKIGDLVCITDVGAYNMNFSWQFIKPKEKLIAIEKNTLLEVRKREDFEYRYKRDIF